jgi:hypothetical protein
MAAQVLSPRCMVAASSLDVTALNSLCSGSLEELLAAQSCTAGRSLPPPGHLTPVADGDEAEAGGAAHTAAAAAPADPARAAKVRAATEVVKKSWQFQVRHPGTGVCLSCGIVAVAFGLAAEARQRRLCLRLSACLAFGPAPPQLPILGPGGAWPLIALQATGSVSAAAVLAELGVRRVAHGGPEGMKQVAAGLIKVRAGGPGNTPLCTPPPPPGPSVQ